MAAVPNHLREQREERGEDVGDGEVQDEEVHARHLRPVDWRGEKLLKFPQKSLLHVISFSTNTRYTCINTVDRQCIHFADVAWGGGKGAKYTGNFMDGIWNPPQSLHSHSATIS